MIACWFHKKVIARCVDASDSLPDSTQQHISNCPSCRQFYNFERELTRRLVEDAELHIESPSPFLQVRIMASLDRSARVAEPRRNFLHPVWATALVIAALGVISIPIIRNAQDSNQPPGRVVVSNAGSATQQIASNDSKAPALESFRWAKALNQPLETEMQLVVSDAKSAMQLLAQNFLPGKPLSSPR